ncbi:MAG: hypothetical protein ACRDRD_22470 [Pseudonocardiaceae bacterium]
MKTGRPAHTGALTPLALIALAPALAVALALALGGCSLGSPPPAPTATNPMTAALTQAQRTHEYPSPPTRQRALGGLASPPLAVEAFANGYINWTAATVTGRMRGLAALSVGQARAAMTLAAAQTAQDYELRRGGIANSGTVEAIAPVRGQPERYAVVTRELTTASGTDAYRGLRPSWHVALATVTSATGGGWVVSSWQPEN